MKICQQCKKEFQYLTDNNAKSKKRKFCCFECYKLSKQLQPEELKKCENCGELMQIKKGERRAVYLRNRFCSYKCRGDFDKGKARKHLHKPDCNCILCKIRRGKDHPLWTGGYKKTYRAVLKRKNGGTHTKKEWEQLKKDTGYICLCCGKSGVEVELTKDHIVPLISGGTNDITNLQPLCRSCNSRKNIKTINYFINLIPQINYA